MDYEIKRITPQATLPIRHIVMWPHKPLEYVQLSNDAAGRHFGLFIKNELVSVISIFEQGEAIQFRKFATIQAYQGKGYGTRLLTYIMTLVEKEGYSRIWCNARVNKSSYYNRFGLQETDIRFEKGGLRYVVMEKIRVEDVTASEKP